VRKIYPIQKNKLINIETERTNSNNNGNKQLPEKIDKAKRQSTMHGTAEDRNDNSVVLIWPADAASCKMLTSPAKLCSALAPSPYSNCNINDVRVNVRKNLIAIEMENPKDIDNILPITTLGPCYVQCYRPNQASYLYGVISPGPSGN
jgi:hypothetical protein